MMKTLSQIYIYPVKSLGGISLNESPVQTRGLQYDRRWMLTDAAGQFVTQREIPGMALLGTAVEPPFLVVFVKKNPAHHIRIPLEPPVNNMPVREVNIWDDYCPARVHDREVNHWFSSVLDTPGLQLVYMPDDSLRPADPRYAPAGMPVSFADGYPLLLIGQASFDDLNSRLDIPLPVNRFRPNLVFTGGEPYEEDGWTDFRIGNVLLRGVKPCARCIIPNTDQDTAERTAEPLKTLTSYRKQGHKVLFGQNAIWTGGGEIIRTGQVLEINS